jgi:hypothetical protein
VGIDMKSFQRLGCDNDVVKELQGYVSMVMAENFELRSALHDFVERVDSALLLDEELADAWTDLCDGVVKARKVLDGVGMVENKVKD